MNSQRFPFLWVLARICVGGIFAYAGVAKLLEPSANFEATLFKYGIFSPQWIPWIARILPWGEWLLGVFLIVGYAPRLTALGLGLLSLAFLVALGASPLFLQAGRADCGCFGQSGLHLSVRQVFVVDLVSFVVALRLMGLKEFPWSLHSFLLKRGHPKVDTKNT